MKKVDEISAGDPFSFVVPGGLIYNGVEAGIMQYRTTSGS